MFWIKNKLETKKIEIFKEYKKKSGITIQYNFLIQKEFMLLCGTNQTWECRKLRSRLLLISMCLISSNGAQNLLYDCRRRQIAHFIQCRSTFRIPTKLCSTKFVQSNRNVDDSLEC